MVEHQAIASDTAAQVEYRDIPGYPGYQVGSDGSIWSTWRSCNKGRFTSTRHRLKPCINEMGYYRFSTTDDCGRRRKLYVHRAVLLAFSGPCPEGMECLHINSIPTDCRVENLRWGTREENRQDVIDRDAYKKGEDHGMTTLTANEVREIRKRSAAGESHTQMAPEYGVGRRTIDRIVNRYTWKHLD